MNNEKKIVMFIAWVIACVINAIYVFGLINFNQLIAIQLLVVIYFLYNITLEIS